MVEEDHPHRFRAYSVSQNGMTDSDSRTWVMLRIGRPAVQSHKRKESVYDEIKVCRFRCPCRDDCSRSSGARWGGKSAGDNTESRRVDSETGKETGTCGAVEVLLRGGSNRLRAVLATDQDGGQV